DDKFITTDYLQQCHQLSLEHVELLRCYLAVLVLLHQLVQLIRHTAPHHLRWPGCLLGALAEYRLDPGHPHRHNLTGVIHCQRIGPVL
ncbi:hypothetical protein ACQVAO_005533, partial [Escherichia coli]